MFGIGETLGKVFGTDKALTSVIDNVASGLDKLVYTDQEQAADAAKAITEGRAMIIEWMKSTQGQNLARRIIALAVTGVWLMQFVIAWLFDIAAIFVDNAGTSAKLMEASAATGERGQSMMGAVMLILGFYFAAPHMGRIAEAAMSKFGKAQSGNAERAG